MVFVAVIISFGFLTRERGMFMSSKERLFRNSVFGGFNKDDVIDYVENMKNEFFEYRSQVEQTVRQLNKKVGELEKQAQQANRRAAEAEKRAAEAIESSEAAAAAQKAQQERLELEKAALSERAESGDPLEEINLATDHLRRVADEICDSLSGFIDKISESSIAVTLTQPEEQISKPKPAAFEMKEENKTHRTVTADAESILSFIDGILASSENRKKEEKKESQKEEPSLLDGLLPDELFS